MFNLFHKSSKTQSYDCRKNLRRIFPRGFHVHLTRTFTQFEKKKWKKTLISFINPNYLFRLCDKNSRTKIIHQKSRALRKLIWWKNRSPSIQMAEKLKEIFRGHFIRVMIHANRSSWRMRFVKTYGFDFDGNPNETDCTRRLSVMFTSFYTIKISKQAQTFYLLKLRNDRILLSESSMRPDPSICNTRVRYFRLINENRLGRHRHMPLLFIRNVVGPTHFGHVPLTTTPGR